MWPRNLNSLRITGIVLIMLAATIGAGSVWIWMHSHVAWQNHLQRAFNSGLRLSDMLRQQASPPIVPDPSVKAAFCLTCSDHAVGAQPQPSHARGIGFHMGFADQPAVHAGIAQVIAHGHFADPEREAVPLRPVG